MENSAATELYDLLITRDFDPEILDSAGKSVTDPAEAELFSFDWKTPNKNYGTVVVLLGADNNLEVYFGDNLGRTMEGDDKQEWYEFLNQMKRFSSRNMLQFNLENIKRLKYTMQGMAAIKEGLFEGYYGNRKVSYSDQPKQTRLVIKHSRPIGEGEARFRHIENLFVETDLGERFRLPFVNLAGGRAMARHCSEGGNPYDAFGQYISEMVAEMNTLARFLRATKNKQLDHDASQMVEQAIRHYRDIKAKAKQMISRRGYLEAREVFNPAEITETEQMVEEIRTMFIEKRLDHRIEEALPILAKLKETGMKEANEFENWAHSISEGTWALPDTPDAQKKFQALLSKPLIVGPDATNATEQLYDIFGDDQLFDELDDLALTDPDADARDIVMRRAKELGILADAQPVEENFGGGGLQGAPFGGTEPMSLDSPTGKYLPVKVTRLPAEGNIHEIPGDLNRSLLPGLEHLQLDKDDYSDTLYYRDPKTDGVFAVYYHGRIPRIRGTDNMSEDRVMEIAKSLAFDLAKEDLDTDGVMMTRPSNMSSESKSYSDINRIVELARP